MNVIVTGPESSGTRFVSRWLEAHPDITARHWSMPSGERWMRHWPTDHDFDGEQTYAIVLVIRAFEPTIKSQLSREMTSSREESEAMIIQALMRSLTWATSHGYRVYPLLYDDVVANPLHFNSLFEWLGVDPVPAPEPVTNESEKWWNPPNES